MMIEAHKDIGRSIGARTRPPRPGEIDGVHYHFFDTETFKKMAADGEFLEWAHVFGHRYGTPRARVDELLEAGKDVLFDIDWQGAQQLYQEAGPDVVRLSVLPPTMEGLEGRLPSATNEGPGERRVGRKGVSTWR